MQDQTVLKLFWVHLQYITLQYITRASPRMSFRSLKIMCKKSILDLDVLLTHLPLNDNFCFLAANGLLPGLPPVWTWLMVSTSYHSTSPFAFTVHSQCQSAAFFTRICSSKETTEFFGAGEASVIASSSRRRNPKRPNKT